MKGTGVKMQDLSCFCEYFYRDSLIPIYVYQDYNLIFSCPKQATLTSPPISYLDILWLQEAPLSYTPTPFYSFFGCIRLQQDPSTRLVIGPVTNVPYHLEALRIMYREYYVTVDERKDFDGFFHSIPTMTITAFVTKLLFLSYMLNRISLNLTDIIDTSLSQSFFEMTDQHAKNMHLNKETGVFNNSYDIEKQLIGIIEGGNIEALKNFPMDSPTVHEGVIATNAIRQAKNTSIVIITVATRAAIRGGLPTEAAFQLSDLYIQKVETLTTIEALYQLNYEAIYDFTYRVSMSQVPATSDNVIQKAVQYIMENTNVRLTAADIAKHFGFSRSYFTRRFKNELGFDLSAFILRCKLEEAKYLLAYTDRSLSHISNYLCFSSQSHFQTSFKKQYGRTPMEYRKKPLN